MRFIFQICCLLFFSIQCQAIRHYEKGDTLQVWAKSGLLLRTDRSTKSMAKELIPYGAEIIVLEAKNRNKQTSDLSIDFFKNRKDKAENRFTLQGDWVAIKYGNKKGYVIDTYLSHYPELTWRTQTNSKGQLSRSAEALKFYLYRIGGDTLSTVIRKDKGALFYHEKWIAEAGIVGEELTSDRDYSLKLVLYDFSKEEVFLIMDNMMELEKRINEDPENYQILKENPSSLHIKAIDGTIIKIIEFGKSTVLSLHDKN